MTPDEREYLWQDLETALALLRVAIRDGADTTDALEAIDDTIAALREGER